MKTFFLAAPGKTLKGLAADAHYSFIHKQRAVMVFAAGVEPPPELVVEAHPGNRGERLSNWARRSPLDELQTEFLGREEMPTAREQSAAIRAFKQARLDRAEYEAQVAKAQQREYEAARGLVRVFGRGPVVIDDVTFDPSYQGETVFYIPRKGNGETDE